MSKEQRLIDANVPIRDLTAMKSMYDAISLDGMIKALKEAPTVDAVEVVRCKDCRHFVTPQGVPCCDNFFGLGFPHPSGDDFCSYGERRNDG